MPAPLLVTQTIQGLLLRFRGLAPLKELFWTVLNYERANQPLTRRAWPESAQSLLDGDPLLLATAGAGDEFHVIYVRLKGEALRVAEERAVVAQLLRDHPYALFVFSNRDQDRWHFVNVKVATPLDTDENRDASRRRLFRRITVAPGELLRTGAERLVLLDVEAVQGGANASALAIQERHDEAFDVEAVTRAFYRQYHAVFEQVEALITGFGNDADRKRLFTQRLFNRLMFLAFVQKKGWMIFGGSTDYLEALWKDYRREVEAAPADGHNFYRDRLQILFFSALNAQVDVAGINQGGFLRQLIGEVPYLNGGLFESDDLDEMEGITVPDRALDLIFHELFAHFNFTVAEATPLDVEVAVDPEMLGRVFEELVTGRHESGSYYTPKPIVSFMCREALKGYLHTEAPQETSEALARFVDEHDATGLRDGEAVLEALKEVRACDPACGSGAYLLGLLHELLDLREALFATRRLDAVSIYERKLEIIRKNLYGVDLDDFAINIARLRLWLSLVVDFERDDPGERIPPLPNLDFKIEQGDSLAAPQPGGHGLSAEVIYKFQRAKADYLTAHHGAKRVAREEVEKLRADLAGWAHAGGKVEGFDWWVEFAEVFAERPAPVTIGGELNLGQELAGSRPGGFDIVLANPPYVRMELFKEQKPTLRRNFPEVHSDRADLYVYFYGRALQLLAPGGMLAFISPNKWFRSGYGKKLRKHVGENTRVESITDFGDLPVFDSATAYPMIFVAQKGKPSKNAPGPLFTEPRSLEPPYPDVRALVDEAGGRLPASSVRGEEWRLTDAASAAVLASMEQNGTPLGEYVGGQILRGVVTGLNAAFVIDGATREALIRDDPRSAEVITPLCTGRDVRRWLVQPTDRWLIYMPHGVEAERYPAILDHLRPFREQLEERATRQEWYELQQPQAHYTAAMEGTKIVTPDIGRELRFALDTEGFYTTNTAYFIPRDDVYLLGVLNSSAIERYYSEISSQIRGGYLRFFRQYVERIPIPRATPADRDAIAELAQKCLDAGGTGPGVVEWEAEIDERVAALYGLKGVPGRGEGA